ncbi:MAG: hypothetical protein ACR2QF_05045 [Geminicoccaceae bacterium]
MPGMKQKTIASVISRKVKAWASSIDDDDLAKRAHDHAIVTGGSITSMLLGERVNDFDIYFSDFGTARDLAEYYLKKMKVKSKVNAESYVKTEDQRVKIYIKSAGAVGASSNEPDAPSYDYFETMNDGGEAAEAFIDQATKDLEEKPPYEPVFASTNAITLSGKVQLIFRFWGDPATIHKNYDFVHCLNYWTSQSGLVLNKDALAATLSKTLVYSGSKYPVCSIFRTRKFIERGWRITAGQMLKMSWQVADLDLTDFDVMEDQLTGVDVAYFHELIGELKKNGDKVEEGYLFKLIDRVM